MLSIRRTILIINDLKGFHLSSLPQPTNNSSPMQKMPSLRDPNLRVELVASGLKYPTAMAFVGNDDILVLEKNNDTIRRIVNGKLFDKLVSWISMSQIR